MLLGTGLAFTAVGGHARRLARGPLRPQAATDMDRLAPTFLVQDDLSLEDDFSSRIQCPPRMGPMLAVVAAYLVAARRFRLLWHPLSIVAAVGIVASSLPDWVNCCSVAAGQACPRCCAAPPSAVSVGACSSRPSSGPFVARRHGGRSEPEIGDLTLSGFASWPERAVVSSPT